MTSSIIVGKITKINKRGLGKPVSVDITGFRQVEQRREEDQTVEVQIEKLPTLFQDALTGGADKGTVGTYTFTVEMEDEEVISVTHSQMDMYDYPKHRVPIQVPEVMTEAERERLHQENLALLP